MRRRSAFALILPAVVAGAALLVAGCGSDSGFKPPDIEATVTISPDSVFVKPEGQIAFTAQVAGLSDSTLSWSVNGVKGGNSVFGTITSDGVYTAPSVAPADPHIAIRATSVFKPTVYGDALAVVMTVLLTPSSAAMGPGEQLDFEAEVLGLENQSVAWSVNGEPGGGAEYGTIDEAGLYTAPQAYPAAGTIAVGATSVADESIHGSASVAMISVSVSPGTYTVAAGLEVQLTAEVSGLDDADLSWSVNGVAGGNEEYGTVGAQGLYTAPSLIPGSTTFTVRCTCADHPTAYGEASITVVRALLVSPTAAALGPSEQLELQADVAGVEDQSVTWSVNGVPGGSAEYGTIDAAGLYTAPDEAPAEGTATVRATSLADPSLHGDATITVITVSIDPETATIGAGQEVDFDATVTGLDGAGVIWLVEGIETGNGTVGLINSRGTYRAPNMVFGETVFTITAVCAGHPTARADATVTVIEPVAIELESYDDFTDTGGTEIYVTNCGTASGGQAVEGFDVVGEALFYQVSFDREGYYAGVLQAAADKGVVNQITVTLEGAGPGGEDQSAVFEVVGMGST